MRRRQDPSDPKDLPYELRIDRAKIQRDQAQIEQPHNLDRTLMIDRDGVNYRTAMYSKTLRHNEYGEVADHDFVGIEVGMTTGLQLWYDRIQRAPGAVRKLVNPQAALAFQMEGADSWSLTMEPAPSMISGEAASEMIEVYGMALLRDEPFKLVQNGTSGQAAIVTSLLNDLNNFGPDFKGPKVAGEVTRGTLFRGKGVGETVGPYVSQLLLHDFNYGNLFVDQLIELESDDTNATSIAGWLDIQNGITPCGANRTGIRRRAYCPRSLGSYVHNDPLGQAHYNAAIVLLGAGAPLDQNFPTLPNEVGFATFGGVEALSRAQTVTQLALQAAWRQKWCINLRLRPEVYAGRVNFSILDGVDYGLDTGVITAATTAHILAHNTALGDPTYLLPLMYPEGSPAHPSYPAGHAVVAGACTTVLKAFFDEETKMTDLNGGTFKIIEPVTGEETIVELEAAAITDPAITDQITVGVELNKLASNIATGRNMAGVHYRSDGDQGILLGEKVAIQYLKDVCSTYNEEFPGYRLTKFDGTPIVITPDS